jgi:hypothetical protein
MFGLHHSKESNLKNSNSHKGKMPSLETRKKNSESNLGKIPINKGLTNKELYGEERAAEISKKISISCKNPSDETRKRKRLSAINRINKQIKNGGQIQPRYNFNGCEYFECLMNQTKTFIQHAENGGEYELKELGYFADGYDKENNIWYECDESHHYSNDTLKNKDIKIQNEIVEKLGCRFVRIKEFKS